MEKLVNEVLEEFESELYLLKWEQRGKEWVLELLIDKEESVTTSDCADVSGRVSSELDEKGLIEKEYVLQVSSPGLERPLIEARHFAGAVGGKVEVNTYGPIDDTKEFVGLLKKYDEDGEKLEMEVDGKIVNIPLDNVSKATTKDTNLEV